MAAGGFEGAALAVGMLGSLTTMGASRKIFGPEVVQQRLVPHRVDIGVAAFFTIGVGVCVQAGLVGATWGPGGDMHLIPAALAQLGYVSSLIARGDLPPAYPTRLVLLVCIWVGLAFGTAATQVLLEVASLWTVKLHVFIDTAKVGDIEATAAAGGDAPYIKARRNSKSKLLKPAAKPVRKSPRTPKR